MALKQFEDMAKSLQVLDGTTYAYVSNVATIANPEHTFLLLHGWPSSSYDWRHQIQDLNDLGYGVIAPDLLGYGDTDKPADIDKYKFKIMASHIAEILKAEGREKIVGVSHDWGSGLLSRLVNYYPDLFEGLVFVSVPYMEPGTLNLDAINEQTEQIFGYPVFGYWPFFNEDDSASICDQNNAAVTSLLYPTSPSVQREHLCPYGAVRNWISNGTVTECPDWLSESEVAVHNGLLASSGYRGTLNWYKCQLRGFNDEDEAAIPEERKIVHTPTLFVNGNDDPVTRTEIAEQISQSGRLYNVTIEKFEGAGHWVYLEKRKQFLDVLKRFVTGF